MRKAQAVQSGYLTEQIAGATVVQLFGREQATGDEYLRLGGRYLKATKTANIYDALLYSLMDGISAEVKDKAFKGAEILFLPHASPRGTAIDKHRSWMRHLTARAFDNSVFVVACNQTGYNGKGLTFPGNAVVLDPAGNIIGQSLSSRETIVFVDLKAETFDTIRGNRMHFFLPNRRPELYHEGSEGG